MKDSMLAMLLFGASGFVVSFVLGLIFSIFILLEFLKF